MDCYRRRLSVHLHFGYLHLYCRSCSDQTCAQPPDPQSLHNIPCALNLYSSLCFRPLSNRTAVGGLWPSGSAPAGKSVLSGF